jgi:hypothetical protein
LFEKHSYIKFHENPSIWNRVVSCGKTDGQNKENKSTSQLCERKKKKKGTEEEGKKEKNKKGINEESNEKLLLLSGVPLREASPHRISSCSYSAYSDYNKLLFYENSVEYRAQYCKTRCSCKQGK